MRLPKFEYAEPKTLKGAVKSLASDTKRTALLAGGTDLLVNMKHRLIEPKTLINLKTIPNLRYLADGKDGVRIGALTTLHEIAASPGIIERYPALSEAARDVGAYAHQAMGTVGGNLCQANRCRFYNQSLFWRSARAPCLKTGGSICHVVPRAAGGPASKECHSTYCGDMAPVLMALNSRVKIVGPDGERELPLKRLYTGIGKKPLALKKGEILREVLIPPASGKTYYFKWRLRDSIEFPILSIALNVESEGKEIKAKILFSGVGPGPVEPTETENLLRGAFLDDRVIETASARAMKELSPMRTSIYSPAYKRKMAGILLKQALEHIMKS
jgi:4-hydroxybenzoyl-CoA reductase beta subunit